MSATHLSLDGKVALVTGASRGIGQAIAKVYAQAGAFVYATSTSESGAAYIQAYLDVHGRGICLNVNDKEAVDALMQNIVNEKKCIDILVNNAGITQDALALRMKSEQWQNVLQTNLHAVFDLCQAAIKPMARARSGCIINITSVIAAIGNAGQANYAASKAGVVAMTQSLAKELGGRNIRINCIAPGFITTDMTAQLSDEQKADITQHIALQRLGDVEDVAQAALFLASSAANYITGSVLHVNGGMYMNH